MSTSPLHRPTAALVNFLYLTVGHAFYKAAGLIALVLIAHWLGSVDFGRFVIALAAAQLAEYLTDLGLNQALVRDTAGRPERLRQDLATLIPLKLLLATATVAICVVLVLAARADPALIEIAFYMGLSHGLSTLTVGARSIFQALERMEFEALSVALEGWVRLGAVLYAVVTGFGVLGFAKIYAVASFVVFAATFVVILHRFVRPALEWRWRRASSLLAAGLPFSLVWLLLASDQRINSLLLARIWGDAEVGLYGAAIRLLEPMLIVPSVLAVTFFPVVVRHERDQRGTFGVLLLSTQKALLIISLPLALMLVLAAPLVVPIVFGDGFARAEWPLRVLAVALVLMFARIGLAQALLATGRWRAAIAAQAVGLAVDLTLAAALVPGSAEGGAAIATVGGSAAAVAASWLALRDRVGRDFARELARPILPAVGAAAAGAAVVEASIPVAVLIAAGAYLLGMRAVRVFSRSDAGYIRAAVPPLASAISFAVSKER